MSGRQDGAIATRGGTGFDQPRAPAGKYGAVSESRAIGRGIPPPADGPQGRRGSADGESWPLRHSGLAGDGLHRSRAAEPARGTRSRVARSSEPAAQGDAQKEATVARRIRAQGLAAGRSCAAIAVTIHDECEPLFGTTWIRAYRLAAGNALADVVEQVRACYEHEGREPPRFCETLLSAYESGHKRPGPEYLHYLCAVYRAEPADLGYPARCFCGRDHRAAGRDGLARGAESADPAATEAHGYGGAGSAAAAGIIRDRAAHRGEEHEDVLRRTLLQLIGGTGAALDSRLFGAIDGVRRRLDDVLLGSGVAATTLDQWEEAATGYGCQYMTVPPLRLLCDVLLDLGDLRRMCEARQPIEAQERLCRLAAQFAALSGMIMIDIGDQRLARSFFRTARTAADEMGDRGLRAWVVAREALVPLYYGEAGEALRLARISQDLAGRTPCAAAALGPMIEARALAKKGRGCPATTDRTRRAIARAHAVFARLSQDQRSDTAFGYTERQLLFHEGEALAGLGSAEADRVLSDALDAYPQTERLDRSLISFDRAMFRLIRGDVEEALQIGEETIRDLPASNRPEIVLRRARDLAGQAAAAAGDHSAVRSFRDQLDALPAAVEV